MFICPEYRRDSTKPVVQAQFGPCSYIYTYPAEKLNKIRSAPLVVLAYEPLEDHQKGISVLYADGHCAFIPRDQAKQFIARDNAVAAQSWIGRLVARGESVARLPLAGRVVPERARDDVRGWEEATRRRCCR